MPNLLLCLEIINSYQANQTELHNNFYRGHIHYNFLFSFYKSLLIQIKCNPRDFSYRYHIGFSKFEIPILETHEISEIIFMDGSKSFDLKWTDHDSLIRDIKNSLLTILS